VNRNDAHTTAIRMTTWWPNARWPGATIDMWTEELQAFAEGPVNTALVRLRQTLDQPPTVAQLRKAVADLDTTRPGPRTPCRACGDTGYDGERWEKVRSHEYAFGVPCHCARGADRKAAHERWGRTL
jgi:hypothetical protein